jgi:purine-nucleoside phosphorylase
MPERVLSLDERVSAANEYLRRRLPCLPSAGLILGSGLGDFADTLPGRHEIPASDIPYYPAVTVESHRGRLVVAETARHRSTTPAASLLKDNGSGVTVAAFQGRLHFYESNDAATVLFPILVAQRLGIRTLIVTNAAGGINRQFSPGDLMVITDHINMTGVRTSKFLSGMGQVRRPLYDRQLSELASDLARSLAIPIRSGVYAGLKGPSYETAAEVDMLHRLGADAVGMSTVLEVHLAAALGMRVLGISCITNKATGFGAQRLDHAEVTEVAARVRTRFTQLLTGILDSLPG